MRSKMMERRAMVLKFWSAFAVMINNFSAFLFHMPPYSFSTRKNIADILKVIFVNFLFQQFIGNDGIWEVRKISEKKFPIFVC